MLYVDTCYMHMSMKYGSNFSWDLANDLNTLATSEKKIPGRLNFSQVKLQSNLEHQWFDYWEGGIVWLR